MPDDWPYAPAAIPPHFADAVHLGDEPESAALALADWLDEQGDGPRARFVRLSVALRRDPFGAEAAALVREHGWLWRACGERWAAGLPEGIYLDEAAEVDTSLGLIDLAAGEAGTFVRLGPRLFAEAEVRGVEPWPSAGGAWPPGVLDALGRDRVRRLMLEVPEEPAARDAVWEQVIPWPPRLRELTVRFLSPDQEVEWAAVPPPRGLRYLTVDSFVGPVPDALACPEAWAELASLALHVPAPRTPAAGVFPHLRHLDLSGPAPWDVFAGPECVPNLRTLTVTLEDEAARDADGRTLGEWTAGLRLERLEAWSTPPRLALAPDSRVGELALGGFGRDIPAAEWRALLAWGGLAGVRELRLADRPFRGKFVTALAQAARGGALERLDVGVALSAPQALAILRDGLAPGQLRELELTDYSTKLKPASWPALGGTDSGLRELRVLDLSGFDVPAAVAAGWVAELPLERLAVGSLAGVDATTAAAFGRSPTLREVVVWGSPPDDMPPPGFVRIQNAWVRVPR